MESDLLVCWVCVSSVIGFLCALEACFRFGLEDVWFRFSVVLVYEVIKMSICQRSVLPVLNEVHFIYCGVFKCCQNISLNSSICLSVSL